MGRIYRFLGLTVGVNLSQMPHAEKQVAYAADITYGTNNEFGFDYLRDNMVFAPSERVQRGLDVRDRRRGRLDPDRRGAHAAHHLGPGRRQRRDVLPAERARAEAHAAGGREGPRRLLGRREGAPGAAVRGRPRARRGDAGQRRPDPAGHEPLRRAQHLADASPVRRAARARAVPSRPALRRAERRGDHRRRVHRPPDVRAGAGPTACTRRSRRRKACRSSARTRRSRRSRSRTTSACTASSPA